LLDMVDMLTIRFLYVLTGTMLKIFMIGQFRNAELAELQTKQNYRDVLNYFMGMVRFLIREGTLKDEGSGNEMRIRAYGIWYYRRKLHWEIHPCRRD